MSGKLEIRISPDGKVQARVKGMNGPRCAEYIEILEQLLDAETVDSTYTDEYYRSETSESEKSELRLEDD
ncbi:MAG: DUF2997 domain-containing protein [Actinomycetota bacterium]